MAILRPNESKFKGFPRYYSKRPNLTEPTSNFVKSRVALCELSVNPKINIFVFKFHSFSKTFHLKKSCSDENLKMKMKMMIILTIVIIIMIIIG